MHRFCWLLALGLSAPALPAAAYDIAQNGGFETTPLASWQTFSQGHLGGQGSWYSHTSGNGTWSGLPTSPPSAGSRQAVADNSGRVAAILYQDITLPATTRATLSFVLWHGNAAPGGSYVNGASLSPTNTNQRVRVDLINPGTNLLTTTGALALLYQTGASTPVVVNPTTITSDLTAFAGQTVRLRVAIAATNGGLIAGIDQVKLEISPFSILPPMLPSFMPRPYSCWGDFDNDGRLDLAFSGEVSPGVLGGSIHRWNMGGFWEQMATTPQGFAIAPADVDADGDLDLGISGVIQDFALGTMINDGFGGFSTPYYSGVGAYSGSLAFGDYDRDGDLDALVTGDAGPYVSRIARNDGTAGFTTVDAGLRGQLYVQSVWADINNDGALDVAQTGTNETDFYFGDGYGGFGESSNGLPPISNAHVRVADLDNDGTEELLVVGAPQTVPPGFTKVYKYDGFGNWNEMAAGLTQLYSSDATIGDFDHDGWLDIATLGTTGSQYKTQLWHNNGNGTFTDIAANLLGVAGGPIDFGDFDADGDLDLLVYGYDGFSVLRNVFLNSTPTPNAAPTPPGLLFSQLSEIELLLRFGSFGNDDHTPPENLTRNFRAGTAPGTCNLVPPMSDLATGRRLVAQPGESRLASWKRLALNRIGHHHAVHWSVQNVDQSYRGSAWAPEQTAILGPTLLSVADVPNDQGGRVRVTVQKSPLDDEARTTYAAMGYNVWRLIPETLASAVKTSGVVLEPAAAKARLVALAQRTGPGSDALATLAESEIELVEWDGRLFTRAAELHVGSPFPSGTWEIVASWFANQQASVVVATTTLADSTAESANDQTYIVTVHTTTPSVWFASLPVSGHSVDNLAPGPPVGLVAHHHTGSGNQLLWEPAPEIDFESFRIYRGTTPGFVAGPATRVASVPAPAWTDLSYDSPIVFYKVSTTDHAGNESPAVAPGATTAVGEGARAIEFALGQAAPNPFTASTRIRFTLPARAPVRLEVFDASGRLVRSVLDGWQPAGEHEARWDGNDLDGRPVRAGIYFYRLEAGERSATRRVARMP